MICFYYQRYFLNFSLLEERLSEASAKARNGEEENARLTLGLSSAMESLVEKDEQVKGLGAELTRNAEEIRELKESLRMESERQVG